MFGEPENESVDAPGERVAALYKQLSYPSAARFKAALAKRGLNVPDAFVKQLVNEQGSRQLFAPPRRASRAKWSRSTSTNDGPAT